jgi:hypothetical protein
MDQNNPAMTAAVHTITRAPVNSSNNDSVITAIHPKSGDF